LSLPCSHLSRLSHGAPAPTWLFAVLLHACLIVCGLCANGQLSLVDLARPSIPFWTGHLAPHPLTHTLAPTRYTPAPLYDLTGCTPRGMSESGPAPYPPRNRSSPPPGPRPSLLSHGAPAPTWLPLYACLPYCLRSLHQRPAVPGGPGNAEHPFWARHLPLWQVKKS